MERVGGHTREVEDAKGMLTTALFGVIIAIVVNDFISSQTFDSSLTQTVMNFIVPIIAVAVLLKILGYV